MVHQWLTQADKVTALPEELAHQLCARARLHCQATMKHCKITKTRSVHLTGMSHTALRKNTSCQWSTHGLRCRLEGGGGVGWLCRRAALHLPQPTCSGQKHFFTLTWLAGARPSKTGGGEKDHSCRNKYIVLFPNTSFLWYFILALTNKQTNRKEWEDGGGGGVLLH